MNDPLIKEKAVRVNNPYGFFVNHIPDTLKLCRAKFSFPNTPQRNYLNHEAVLQS